LGALLLAAALNLILTGFRSSSRDPYMLVFVVLADGGTSALTAPGLHSILECARFSALIQK
jgi:hypothetical protein